jgi:hypothetical protein
MAPSQFDRFRIIQLSLHRGGRMVMPVGFTLHRVQDDLFKCLGVQAKGFRMPADRLASALLDAPSIL